MSAAASSELSSPNSNSPSAPVASATQSVFSSHGTIGSSLLELDELYARDKSLVVDKPGKFYGWVRSTREGGGGKFLFIDIYDGTRVGDLKCMAEPDKYLGDKYTSPYDNYQAFELTDSQHFPTLTYEQLGKAETLSIGTAVVVDGLYTQAPEKATQKYEFSIHRLRVIGRIYDHITYPVSKSAEKKVETLRKMPFMRIRTQIMQSIFRITSKLEFAIYSFMDSNNVIKLDPNILTMSDCEGAGETFQVLPLMFSKDAEGKDLPVGLTVSSQLPLESGITGLKHVYTSQKSFRAERSDTIKHLAEFLHIEYEGAFITLDNLLTFTEKMVKYVIDFTFKGCKADFDFIENARLAPSDMKPSRALLAELITKPFVRIKHCDAIALIQKIVKEKIPLPDDEGQLKKVKVDKLPQAGEDIGSEHEKLLVKYFGYMQWVQENSELTEEARAEKLKKEKKEFGAFVFLTHWPLKIKSFYMKQCDDGSGESESFDLLVPRVGEMFGGSMREWRYEKLAAEVERRKMDISPIQWFLELRKNGSMPHGGWGLGFARFATLLTGAPSVRDTVFLPVYYGHCPY